MKTLIIYDTYYGNTLKIAKNIAKILEDLKPEILKVDVITQTIIDNYELIIIGSPTRVFNMTKKIKKLISKLDFKDKKIFVFDTRADVDKIEQKFLIRLMNRYGYAAEKMEKILLKNKAKKIMDYKYYYVKDSEGPLEADYLKLLEEDMSVLVRLIN